MNRRSFIGTVIGAIGAFTLDPEALLWKPDKKIFIPKATYAERKAVIVMNPRVFPGLTLDSIHHIGKCGFASMAHWREIVIKEGSGRIATAADFMAAEQGKLRICPLENNFGYPANG